MTVCDDCLATHGASAPDPDGGRDFYTCAYCGALVVEQTSIGADDGLGLSGDCEDVI
jgi:hypothetical protein